MTQSSTANIISSGKPTLSIVIPVHNGGESFRRCLTSLECFAAVATEIIIVVDGGTDASYELAQSFSQTVNAQVIKVPQGGPARARNLGAYAAHGDLLFFIDADVMLASDTLEQVLAKFCANPKIAALIGSYDDAPGASNFLSQYKNLFHHYTHQTGSEEASTFWGACGAVRREVFLEVGGFDEAYRYPSIEDIELGYRLKRSGYSICLCKQVQVKHLKRWEPFNLLRAEIFYRALPWTELLWRDRQFVNDLNLQTSSRLSIILVYSLLLALVAAFWWIGALGMAGIISLALLMLNLPVYQFFLNKQGLIFTLKVVPWHWFYYCYGGFAFAIGTLRYHLFSKRNALKTRLSQV